MSAIEEFNLETDDDTYIYGGLKFTAESIDGELIEPYTHIESDTRIVEFYRSKNLFVVYDNNRISELIFTMTCWSDDYKAYKLRDNIAYSYTECYHGRRCNTPKDCNIDFTEFIAESGL